VQVFETGPTHLYAVDFTLAFFLVSFSQVLAKRCVVLSALQIITVLKSGFFWARSATVDLGEGRCKPQRLHLQKAESKPRRGVLLFEGTALST
jgi:hypothetical protein